MDPARSGVVPYWRAHSKLTCFHSCFLCLFLSCLLNLLTLVTITSRNRELYNMSSTDIPPDYYGTTTVSEKADIVSEEAVEAATYHITLQRCKRVFTASSRSATSQSPSYPNMDIAKSAKRSPFCSRRHGLFTWQMPTPMTSECLSTHNTPLKTVTSMVASGCWQDATTASGYFSSVMIFKSSTWSHLVRHTVMMLRETSTILRESHLSRAWSCQGKAVLGGSSARSWVVSCNEGCHIPSCLTKHQSHCYSSLNLQGILTSLNHNRSE
jgi:hypothetical protein